MPLVGRTTRAPELVFGLVGPIGTDLPEVGRALQTALKVVGYESDVVRLSQLLPDTVVPTANTLPGRDDPNYYRRHMDAGDSLRELFQSGDALAGYAIRRIRAARGEVGDVTMQQRRYATILNSLKHEDEVELLRATYRSRFILVGASASLEQRTATLEASLADQGTQFSNSGISVSEEVAHLLQRDENDPTNEYGQHVRTTFAKADAFLWLTGDGEELNRQGRRVVELTSVGSLKLRVAMSWLCFTLRLRRFDRLMLAGRLVWRSPIATEICWSLEPTKFRSQAVGSTGPAT